MTWNLIFERALFEDFWIVVYLRARKRILKTLNVVRMVSLVSVTG